MRRSRLHATRFPHGVRLRGRSDRKPCFRNLYQHPWTAAERAAPEIVDVDAVTTDVSQAWWDAGRKALIVTLQPGPIKAQQIRFKVVRLDPHQRYEVIVDGKSIGTIAAGGSLAGGSMRWDGAAVSVSTPLGTKRGFVFEQAGSGGA